MEASNQSDFTTKKEGISSAKIQSVKSLIFGQRAKQFDALLKRVPTSNELSWLAIELGKSEIESVIFDIDGTLVAPYADIHDEIIAILDGYRQDGRKVGVYTNSPFSDRLKVFDKAGIGIARNGIGKPAIEGFSLFCDDECMNPSRTAMVGNFPITDAPYVPEGTNPYFPMNILVESIPPQREAIPSLKKYFRACLFHALNVASTQVVLARNPGIFRG